MREKSGEPLGFIVVFLSPGLCMGQGDKELKVERERELINEEIENKKECEEEKDKAKEISCCCCNLPKYVCYYIVQEKLEILILFSEFLGRYLNKVFTVLHSFFL